MSESSEAKTEKPAREFIANVTHEVLTPLNAILGFAELLHDDEEQPLGDEQLEFVEDILVSGEQLLSVINDSLDLIRGHVGSLEVKALPTNVAHLVRAAEARVHEFARELGVRVDASVSDSIGLVVADPDRARKIVETFLAEAIRYSPEGARVLVRAEERDGRVRISVDSPQPMAGPELENIFVSVNRGHRGNRCPSFGTGLELPLVALLADGMGGRAEAVSRGAEGIRYSLVFPKVLPASETDAAFAGLDSGYVLVFVPSDRATRIASAALESAGVSSLTATGSADALITVHAETPAAVVVGDVEAAASFLRAMRMTPKFESLPILAWTDSAEPSSAASYVDATMERERGPSQLIAAINRLLNPTGNEE